MQQLVPRDRSPTGQLQVVRQEVLSALRLPLLALDRSAASPMGLRALQQLFLHLVERPAGYPPAECSALRRVGLTVAS